MQTSCRSSPSENVFAKRELGRGRMEWVYGCAAGKMAVFPRDRESVRVSEAGPRFLSALLTYCMCAGGRAQVLVREGAGSVHVRNVARVPYSRV